MGLQIIQMLVHFKRHKKGYIKKNKKVRLILLNFLAKKLKNL
jgi:hypothetical protein